MLELSMIFSPIFDEILVSAYFLSDEVQSLAQQKLFVSSSDHLETQDTIGQESSKSSEAISAYAYYARPRSQSFGQDSPSVCPLRMQYVRRPNVEPLRS
jgi:hypothetical protein